MKTAMKYSLWVILIVLTAMTIKSCNTSNPMEAPVAQKNPKELIIHGDTRIDNYYWLRERENPEVISYLEAENSYRESVMKGSKKFQKELFNEIVGRIKKDDASVPYRDNGYYYYTRFEDEKEYPIICRKN